MGKLSMKYFISLAFALVGGYSIYAWMTTRGYEYTTPKYGDLAHDYGNATIRKPWKTTPYIYLVTNSGAPIELSCAGPFGNSYWCGEIETALAAGTKCSIAWAPELHHPRPLVFEMVCEGGIRVAFIDQIARFDHANKEGPPNGQLFLGLAAVAISLVVIKG